MRSLTTKTKVLLLLIAVVVVLAVLLLRPKPRATQDDEVVAPKVTAWVEVRLSEDGVEQKTIKVHPNTAVTWVNDDNKAHKIVSDNTASGTQQNFETDNIPTNQRYTIVFSDQGSYNYHEQDDPLTTGTVIVAN